MMKNNNLNKVDVLYSFCSLTVRYIASTIKKTIVVSFIMTTEKNQAIGNNINRIADRRATGCSKSSKREFIYPYHCKTANYDSI